MRTDPGFAKFIDDLMRDGRPTNPAAYSDRFVLAVGMVNAAFGHGDHAAAGAAQAEIVRILRDLADRIEQQPSLRHCDGFGVRDINGNTVGRVSTW